MAHPYIFLPSFSITPTRLSLYNSVFLRSQPDENGEITIKSVQEARNNRIRLAPAEKIKRSSHNFEISENAFRTLKKRINWLHHLAKPRKITTYAGKQIFNFRMAFMTLTLPSAQRHDTQFITQNLLNQFLTEIRQRTKMENYVWRLEFQKNKNVHYHLVSDTYLDYFLILKIWNRILSNYGYVQPYTDKHKNLTLSQYADLYGKKDKSDFKLMASRYAKGCQHKWTQPPTVQVNSVVSKQSIAYYLSKYFSKKHEEPCTGNPLDDAENSANLRLWFCSRSLSRLNSISGFLDEINYDIYDIVKSLKNVVVKHLEYATMCFFDLQKTTNSSRAFIERLLKDYSIKQGYTPAL